MNIDQDTNNTFAPAIAILDGFGVYDVAFNTMVTDLMVAGYQGGDANMAEAARDISQATEAAIEAGVFDASDDDRAAAVEAVAILYAIYRDLTAN